MWRLVHNVNRAFRQRFTCPHACSPAPAASSDEKANNNFSDKRLQAYIEKKRNDAKIPFVGCYLKSLEALSVGVIIALSWRKINHDDFQNLKSYLKQYCPILQTTSLRVLPRTAVESKPQITEEKLPSDLDIALKEFAEVSNQYVGSIQNSYGMQYASSNPKLAFHYFQNASKLGSAKALYNLALCYEQGFGTKQDFNLAAARYHQAADAGHTKAIYNLAIYYAQGKGGLEKSLEVARRYFQLAADKGIKEAQTYIGIHYLQDGKWFEAMKLLQDAADQQDHDAEFYLGVCYDFGCATKANPIRAAHYYAKAANAGHSGALYNLAVYYENGLGGLQMDPFHAIELYKKVAHENSDAAYNLKRLNSLYIQKQVEETDTSDCESNLDLYPNSSHTPNRPRSKPRLPSSPSDPNFTSTKKQKRRSPWSSFLNLILPSTRHSRRLDSSKDDVSSVESDLDLYPNSSHSSSFIQSVDKQLILSSSEPSIAFHSSHSSKENISDQDSTLGSSLNSSLSSSPSLSSTFKEECFSPEHAPTLCENNISKIGYLDQVRSSSELSSPCFFISEDSTDEENSSDSGCVFRYEESGTSQAALV